ncbi:hypothetical protein JYU34_022895, partial [Plutella xylostella]
MARVYTRRASTATSFSFCHAARSHPKRASPTAPLLRLTRAGARSSYCTSAEADPCRRPQQPESATLARAHLPGVPAISPRHPRRTPPQRLVVPPAASASAGISAAPPAASTQAPPPRT